MTEIIQKVENGKILKHADPQELSGGKIKIVYVAKRACAASDGSGDVLYAWQTRILC